MFDEQSIQRQPNAALFLEDIKLEVETFEADHSEGTPARAQSAFKRRPSIDSHGISDVDAGIDPIRRVGSHSLKSCKHEDDLLADAGEATFALFASLLDSAFQGAPK